MSNSQTEEGEESETKMQTECLENETDDLESSSSKPSILQVLYILNAKFINNLIFITGWF